MPLVKFIEDHGCDAVEFRIGEEAAGKHAFGDKAEARAWSGNFFEPDLVADGLADTFAALGSHVSGCQPRGQPPGFQDDDIAVAELKQGRGNTRGFAGSGGRFQHESVGFSKAIQDFGNQRVDWEMHGKLNFSVRKGYQRPAARASRETPLHAAESCPYA